MYYIIQNAPRTTCKYCHAPVSLLCNEAGWTDRAHPAFYICFGCKRVFNVGAGEVMNKGSMPDLPRDGTPTLSECLGPRGQSVILALQYCLETLEQGCSCGQCDVCTRGQDDVRRAIRTVEDIILPASATRRVSNHV
jgi:hypothetical protein